jgi:hypothetical protein
VLSSGQKLTLGLQATFTLEAVRMLRSIAPAILNASSCSVRLFSTACGSASITSVCQNGGLSVLSSIVETENSRVGGGGSHVGFGQTFPGEKGNVRRCVVTMQQPLLLSRKFRAKSSHISRSRCEPCRYYAELTVWPAMTNSL